MLEKEAEHLSLGAVSRATEKEITLRGERDDLIVTQREGGMCRCTAGPHNTRRPALYWPPGMPCSGYNKTSWEEEERKAGRDRGRGREKSELET